MHVGVKQYVKINIFKETTRSRHIVQEQKDARDGAVSTDTVYVEVSVPQVQCLVLSLDEQARLKPDPTNSSRHADKRVFTRYLPFHSLGSILHRSQFFWDVDG